MTKGLFISGTDTDAGKTFVTAGLARLLRSRGSNIGVMKPVASGCTLHNGVLTSDDALALKEASGSLDAMSTICPLAFEQPLSPHMAAHMEQATLTDDAARIRIREAYEMIAQDHDLTLVEGVGGFLVPITHTLTIGDIAGDLQLPVLLVARNRLGVINHVLLSLEAIRARRLPVLGIVLNSVEEPDYASLSNRDALQRVTDVPVIGPVPHLLPDATPDEAARSLEHAGIDALLKDMTP